MCLLLLGGAGGASYVIFASEPEAQRESATRKTAALVETIVASRGSHQPTLEVLGQVRAAREILLSPRVAGQIVALEPAFTPGGQVIEGQPLLRIDPADFERMLTMRRSEHRQVMAELALEQGRQEAARREFELLGEEIDESNRALVLREPQIESIRARLDAAEAAVQQAQLDLERTVIRAPFDAQVLTREADVGSQVSPGDALGRLVGSEEYWVYASVPLRDLRWIKFAQTDEVGSSATIRHTTAWEPGATRSATVSRLIGTLDEESRLARVLITLPDPLAREIDGPRAILGSIVQVRIEGRTIDDVIRLERDYLRQADTVWVMNENSKLEIREVEVVFRDATHAFISDGLEAGEHIVTTSLATVSPGLDLRRAEDAESTSPAGEEGPP